MIPTPDGTPTTPSLTLGSTVYHTRRSAGSRASRYKLKIVNLSPCRRYAVVATSSGLEKLVRVSELRAWP